MPKKTEILPIHTFEAKNSKNKSSNILLYTSILSIFSFVYLVSYSIKQHSHIQRLEKGLEAKLVTIKSQAQQNNLLRAELSLRQAAYDQNIHSTEKLPSNLKHLKNVLAQLEKEVKEKNKMISHLNDELNKTKDQNKIINELKQKNADLQADNTYIKEMQKRLADQTSRSYEELNDVSMKCSDIMQKYDALKNDYNDFETKIELQRNLCEHFKLENDSLIQEVKNAKTKLQKLQEKSKR